MSDGELELSVTGGKRYAVPPEGLRFGRSSSCEIAVGDPALSRSHCLFERRDGKLWITDLASANGTYVNGRELAAEPQALAEGDVITAGDTEIRVAAAAPAGGEDAPAALDLGLGERPEDAAPEDAPPPVNVTRLALWAVAGLAVAGAGFLILKAPDAPAAPAAEKPAAVQPLAAGQPAVTGPVVGLSFEKVKASAQGICRFALTLAADGTLSAQVDDVPKANRHVTKNVRLTPEKRERLSALFDEPAFYSLEDETAGEPIAPGTLERVSLRVIHPAHVGEKTVANAEEPPAFRSVRERLEAFARNELGLWGIDKSADDLNALADEAYRTGEAKWDERDVQRGNVAQAIARYEEAVSLLETVNPKPAWYAALNARLREARAELDRRYRAQNFLVDKAINLKDWPAATEALRVLCDIVSDARDARHSEAKAKLLDVEARRKAAKKGAL